MLSLKALRRYKTLALFLVVLIGTPLLAGSPSARAGTTSGFTVVSAVWGTPTTPVEAGPGSQNVPLTITLQYYYYNTAQGISVTLSLPPGFTDTNGNSVVTAYVANQVPSGAVLPVTFDLNIASGVAIGSYLFPMSISWGAITQFNPIQSVSESQNAQATVSLKGKVLLQFSAGQSALTPGAVNHLSIMVTNAGTGNATSVDITLMSSAVISVLNTAPEISVIRPNSSATSYVDIYVAPTLAGSSVPLAIGGTYSDAYGNSRQIAASVGMYVKSISSVPGAPTPVLGLSGYSYSPALIFPGTIVASLQVVILNSGTTSGSNVSATLLPSSPVYPITSGSLSQAAGLLPAGQSAPFTFTLGIQNSTQPMNSTLTLVVAAAGSTPVRFSIPFVEQPKADLKVISVSSPPIASGDGADELLLTLRNEGGAAAQLVTFTMQPSYVFEPSTQGSFTTTANAGVGTISPGKTANLTVIIQVNSNLEPRRYPLVLHASWTQLGATQPFGQDVVLMLPVQVSAFQIANSIIFSVPFLLVLVILFAALIILRRRRRSSRRPAATAG